MVSVSENCNLHSRNPNSMGLSTPLVGCDQPTCTKHHETRTQQMTLRRYNKQIAEWWKRCWEFLDTVVRKAQCLHFIHMHFWQFGDFVVVKEVSWWWLNIAHYPVWNRCQAVVSEIQEFKPFSEVFRDLTDLIVWDISVIQNQISLQKRGMESWCFWKKKQTRIEGRIKAVF